MQDELWMCFFAKLLAIKYDETFDNLDSILRFANEEDRARIEQNLSEIVLDTYNLKAREFARKLRNTIQEIGLLDYWDAWVYNSVRQLESV